ncbi:DUF485 domain-containing protein [Kosakonia sp. H02]|nr:DUF485 domain-containing protein [Kosakonia sp. H02]
MNENPIYQRIENNAHFRELVEKRQRFAFLLSIIMLIIYVGFILLIAFAPTWLGTPLHAGTSVTRGIPIGIGVIVISFVLTAVYVWRANSEFERLTRAVLSEVNAS